MQSINYQYLQTKCNSCWFEFPWHWCFIYIINTFPYDIYILCCDFFFKLSLDAHSCKELHTRSHKFALQNFQQVVGTEEFLLLPFSEVCTKLQIYTILTFFVNFITIDTYYRNHAFVFSEQSLHQLPYRTFVDVCFWHHEINNRIIIAHLICS